MQTCMLQVKEFKHVYFGVPERILKDKTLNVAAHAI